MHRARAGGLLVALLSAGCAINPAPDEDSLPGVGTAGPDEISTVATGLDTIWHIAFAPDGRTFLTERGGRIRVLDAAGLLDPQRWATVGAIEESESGLMGLAFHPEFPATPHVFAMYTGPAGPLRENRIVRLTERDGRGADERLLLGGIPAQVIHDGGRIAFGPDGKLYATTGDAANPANAQDPSSLAGKVLRLNPDGSVPSDNPTPGSYVYTMGHRNPQGLAFHPDSGTPLVSEHGAENHDEVNVLRSGANYGWPIFRGPAGAAGFEPSIWTSGPDDTVAPAGAAFVDAPGSPLDRAFVFGTLKAAQLHVLLLTGDPPRLEAERIVLDNEYGRIRAVTWHDGALYLGTSNKDGRGSPGPDDDRIIRVPLAALERLVDEA